MVVGIHSYTHQTTGEGQASDAVLADASELAQRRSRVFEAHVEPLNRWVGSVRTRLPLGSDVPWFDPAGGGIGARLLWLGDEPDPADLFGSGGTGFVSIDGPSRRSQNLRAAALGAEVDRAALVVWNVQPCNLRELRRVPSYSSSIRRWPGQRRRTSFDSSKLTDGLLRG